MAALAQDQVVLVAVAQARQITLLMVQQELQTQAAEVVVAQNLVLLEGKVVLAVLV
jgi:hypothetical protein